MAHTNGRGGPHRHTRPRYVVLPALAATLVVGEIAWVLIRHV